MRERGAYTIARDERSCAVWNAKEVVMVQAVEKAVPPEAIIAFCKNRYRFSIGKYRY